MSEHEHEVVVYLDGQPVQVPKSTLTGYETREVLGAKDSVIGFEGSDMPISFTDGWDFNEGQRFVTLGSMTIADRGVDPNADTKDMPAPWETDADAWKGEAS